MTRRTPELSLKGKHLSVQWQIVLAFFLGGAVSSLAQDPSDTIFFWASSKGVLSANQAAFYWYWVPFIIYLFLFLLGFVIARAFRLPPSFLVYFYIILIVGSAIASLALPQSSALVYLGSVLLGTIVSIGIALGLMRRSG
jgi:hypothetical protein